MRALPTGILLPESFLHSEFFLVLATFVAINTIAYVALAITKILPKIYLSDWVRGANRRGETRSIHPDAAPRGQHGQHGQHGARHRASGPPAAG